jgi:predicted glycoside hydrolase/deacetylase ChbG (UPF0249 family)
MKSKRLIINADDLGMSRGITDGILRAHREGVVTSASLIVNQAGSEYAVAQLVKYPDLGVGIHLNISEGTPVLPPQQVPTLVTRDGCFYPPAQMVRRLWRWHTSPHELEAEFRAQIRRMKDRGLSITHGDCHHHMHLYPCAVAPFRRALLAEGIHCARAPRHRHWPRDGYIGGPHAGPAYRRLLVCAYADFTQRVTFRPLITPDSCLTCHPRYANRLESLTEGWKAALQNIIPGVYELGCHPSLRDPAFSDHTYWRERRELELRILTDPAFRTVIEENNIELINYSNLTVSGRSASTTLAAFR